MPNVLAPAHLTLPLSSVNFSSSTQSQKALELALSACPAACPSARRAGMLRECTGSETGSDRTTRRATRSAGLYAMNSYKVAIFRLKMEDFFSVRTRARTCSRVQEYALDYSTHLPGQGCGDAKPEEEREIHYVSDRREHNDPAVHAVSRTCSL